METTALTESVVTISNGAVTLGAHLLIQSTLLIAVGLITARLCRGMGVALQSLILRTTLVALIAAPVITYFFGVAGFEGKSFALARASALPEFATVFDRPSLDRPVATPPEASDRNATDPSEQKLRASANHNLNISAPASKPESTPSNFVHTRTLPRRSHLTEIYATLTAAWVIGAFCLLARLAVCHWRIRGLRWQAGMADVAVFEKCQSIAKQLGISTPQVLAHPEVKSPLLVGLFRPAVLLPRLAGSNDDIASREVLLHELAHLARWDCLWHLLGRLATALLFFQPLLWVLTRRIEEAAEDVCDNYVIEHAPDRRSYARQLVDLAERLQFSRSEAVAGVGVIAFKSALGQRIVRILDQSRNMSVRTGKRPVLAIATAGALATGMAGFIGVSAQPKVNLQAKGSESQQSENDKSGRSNSKTSTEVKPLEVSSAPKSAVMTLRKLELPQGFPRNNMSVSPDGRFITAGRYTIPRGEPGDPVGTPILDLSTGATRILTNLFAWTPIFSTDGKQMVFSRTDNNPTNYDIPRIEIMTLDSETEKPRQLYENKQASYMRLTDWSSDGRTVLFAFQKRESRSWYIATLSVSDGSMHVIKELGRWRQDSMKLSPDGRWIVYDAPVGISDTSPRDLFLLAADGSREIPLAQHPADDYLLGWPSSGDRILFASNRRETWDLFALQVTDGKPSGAPELLKEAVGRGDSIGVTRGGTLLYRVETSSKDIYLSALDPESGKIKGAPSKLPYKSEGTTQSPDWSKDGRHLSFVSQSSGGSGPSLVIRKMLDGAEREIKFDPSASDPRWSPDGTIFIASGRNRGRNALVQIDAQTGKTVLLPVEPRTSGIAGWDLDGNAFYFLEMPKNLVRREIQTGTEKRLSFMSSDQFMKSDQRDWGWSYGRPIWVSPDMQQIAFVGYKKDSNGTNAKFSYSLCMIPVSSGLVADGLSMAQISNLTKQRPKINPRELVPVSESEWINFWEIAWTPDGRYLTFRTGPRRETLANKPFKPTVCRVPVSGGEVEILRELPEGASDMRFSPDGQRLAFTVSKSNRDIWVMENFLPKDKITSK